MVLKVLFVWTNGGLGLATLPLLDLSDGMGIGFSQLVLLITFILFSMCAFFDK